MHVLPHLTAHRPYDWVGAMADWWDTHLRREPPSPEPDPPVLFFTSGGGWRAARQWPPEGVSGRQFFLAGHRLTAGPPATPERRDYHGDPLVGLTAGIWDPFGTGHGWPEEQSSDDARSLTFTSDPLPEPLLVAGSPEANLYLDLPPDTELNLAARVCMVSPDGRSTLITTGWRRIPPGSADAHPAAQMITVTLGAAAFELPAGSRVRLCVACADFPHIWPSPANPALSLMTGPGMASVLRLPVSGRADRADTPAAVAEPPAEPDTGWVTDSEPRYRVTQDKAAGETAVTFGARSRLQPPSGADLRLDETFTARVSPGQPAGATVLAQVDISLRLPAGERVQVAVRSTSHRRSSVIAASVALDGTIVLDQRWAGGSAAEPAGPAHP
jgi:predicted acyl esterase